jgi:signal transduction histidine kinase
VFFNLFANALKFRRADACPIVHVSASTATGSDGAAHWIIRIADNGIGIAPGHRESVFEIFQRVHGRGEYEGPRGGLAICRKIIERHGGGIHLEDGADEGVSVVIKLAETPRSRHDSPSEQR